ncbi:chromosome partitioning protein ParB, partial [Escherichia coli]
RDEHDFLILKSNRWVRGCLCSPRPLRDATQRADNLADAA